MYILYMYIYVYIYIYTYIYIYIYISGFCAVLCKSVDCKVQLHASVQVRATSKSALRKASCSAPFAQRLERVSLSGFQFVRGLT